MYSLVLQPFSMGFHTLAEDIVHQEDVALYVTGDKKVTLGYPLP